MRTYEWEAPAKLFFWPAVEGGDEDAVYPTLHDAMQAASEGDADTAWIITRDGDILNPRVIATLREELAERRSRKRSKPFSLLGWARAA